MYEIEFYEEIFDTDALTKWTRRRGKKATQILVSNIKLR